MSTRTASYAEITEWLKQKIAEEAGVKPKDVDINMPWSNGLTSMQVLIMTGALEQYLERQIEPSTFWEYPTIHELAQQLSGKS